MLREETSVSYLLFLSIIPIYFLWLWSNNLKWIWKICFSVFQSLLFASYVHISSEKLVPGPLKLSRYSATWAFDTGLPEIRNPGSHLGSGYGGKPVQQRSTHFWHTSYVQEAPVSHYVAPSGIGSGQPVTRPLGICVWHSYVSKKDREPEAEEALWPRSICCSWVQETGGKKHTAKVPSWRRMGNLENINWDCGIALGGWLSILSIHPRVSLVPLIWEWAVLLSRERSESSHVCFHSPKGEIDCT